MRRFACEKFFFFFFFGPLCFCVLWLHLDLLTHTLSRCTFSHLNKKKSTCLTLFFLFVVGRSLHLQKNKQKTKTQRFEYRLRVLDHPNIVHLYECFEHDDQIHLVMENCEGETFFFPFCRIPVPSSCLSLSLSDHDALSIRFFFLSSSSFPLLPFLSSLRW